MKIPAGSKHLKSLEEVSSKEYDAVIVGSGISGAIIALELSRANKRVLILEAGSGDYATPTGYEDYLNRFYKSATKDNQSPYAENANAPMPRGADARKITPGMPDTASYMVQNGPFATDTTYTRVPGGTTLHWEAKILRMLPQDFKMRTLFGEGADWPIGYDDLEPYYRLAEHEIGVSADVGNQQYLDQKFPNGYVYPMRGLPLSYLDQMVGKGIDGTSVDLYGKSYELKVRPFPQGRNGIPNPAYDGGKGYRPVGAVSETQSELGERCQGHNACVPLCRIQAKYHAGKTLAKALRTECVDILTQSVASKIRIDPDNGRVTEIEFKTYKNLKSPAHTTGVARGRIFVLCANAIENSRLMLASGLQTENGLVGRNLMDHAYLLNWALMPMVCGTWRGTNSTGGIVDLRDGTFRSRQAAFTIDIHNDGWAWAVGSPMSDLSLLVDSQNKFGLTLRRELADRITRQLLLAFMIEVPPSQSNRVSVDPAYTDQLGNMRPVISYSIPEYTMRGAAYARQFARLVFQRLGAADYTTYDPADFGFVTYQGEGYAIRGGNHLAGTHTMGTCPSNSVVNDEQRSWRHDNLFLAGGGSMPTIGTANVTLTLAALCFRSAPAMLRLL
jgi:choline dehydrogenase-like flavoprotein